MATDLSQVGAARLSRLFASGKVSPVESMTAVLARAHRINPIINALTRIDAEESMAAARASEQRWLKGRPLSPLDGVPVSIKELVRVKGWPLTMGSLLTDKTPAQEDAPAVARLREGGAILFAQSASPEYGHKGVTDSPLNGITRNPWHTDHTPGGSSGGGAAAVAAGLGPLAIGTDGGGSIRIPCSFTGLVGLKPTFGRVPAWPPSTVGDLGNTGPMARDARDCALMMNLIARPDPRDPYALPDDGVDYERAIAQRIVGLKVGFMLRIGDHPLDEEVAAHFTAAVQTFRDLGCEVQELAPAFDHARASESFLAHWFCAMQRLLRVYPESEHARFDPSLLAQARAGAQLSVAQVVDAQVVRRELAHAWTQVFTRCDLLLTPTVAVPPFAVGRNFPDDPAGNPNLKWSPYTATFNLARLPAATVPCGLTRKGLPVGLHIIGPHYRDARVLAAAARYQRAAPMPLPVLPSRA